MAHTTQLLETQDPLSTVKKVMFQHCSYS
ncbi:hypothetical protein PanWU01x14_145570 [Parasponia andersonii]|uniref:Uncharacterized protein n=1 Tax=Parasponia andersonii TaxID=3476 RepID=A0A2P5CK60_PARAD|nr:hypothetical protein PanWU01x14_145570 [Parasponia andersonii]